MAAMGDIKLSFAKSFMLQRYKKTENIYDF